MKKLNEPSKFKKFNSFFQTNNLVRFLLFFASGWAGLTLVQYFLDIIFIFTIASLLAFWLNYPVRYLERYLGLGVARGVVIFLSLVILTGVLTTLVLSALYQLQQLSNSLIANIQNLNLSSSSLEQIQNFLDQGNINFDLRPILDMLATEITSKISSLINILTKLPSTFLGLIFTLVLAFFMLTDGKRLWSLVITLIPQPHQQRFEYAIKRSLIGFFKGQFLLCLILSTLSFLAFVLLNISNAGALGIIVAILDIIPGIGATLGVIIISLITLVQGGWLELIKVVVVSVLLQQVQDNFISPKIMQNSVNLNPVVVFFALLVGAKIAGLLGIFLAVPLAGVIVNFLEIEEMQSES